MEKKGADETNFYDDFDSPLKFITIGDSFVGKSSIIQRFTKNKFYTDQLATIGKQLFYNSSSNSIQAWIFKVKIKQ